MRVVTCRGTENNKLFFVTIFLPHVGLKIKIQEEKLILNQNKIKIIQEQIALCNVIWLEWSRTGISSVDEKVEPQKI